MRDERLCAGRVHESKSTLGMAPWRFRAVKTAIRSGNTTLSEAMDALRYCRGRECSVLCRKGGGGLSNKKLQKKPYQWANLVLSKLPEPTYREEAGYSWVNADFSGPSTKYSYRSSRISEKAWSRQLSKRSWIPWAVSFYVFFGPRKKYCKVNLRYLPGVSFIFQNWCS